MHVPKVGGTLDDKMVSYSSSTTESRERFTLDFNNSKARFIRKRAKDKSDEVVDAALRF